MAEALPVDRARHLGCGIALAAILATTACADLVSPSTTTPAGSYATLVVRVWTRGSAEPVHGALVRYRSQGRYTDASGQALVEVMAGEETTIEVSAVGYRPMMASGFVANDERWTFYLEADPAAGP